MYSTPANIKAFHALKSILQPYENLMNILVDQDDCYYLEFFGRPGSEARLFAAVQIRRNYVALHLTCLKTHEELPETFSKYLRSCYVGKGQFNVQKAGEKLLRELRQVLKQNVQVA